MSSMTMSPLRRLHVPFDTLWRMRIEVPYSLLVREGEPAWSCGQCPLDRGGEVLAPFQLAEQTTHVVQFIETILAKAELAPASVGSFVVYHASTSASETLRMRDILLECFGNRPSLFRSVFRTSITMAC